MAVSNPSERGTVDRASKAPMGAGSRKFLYFLYQNGEFLCIPGDIYEAPCSANDMFLSKKGMLIKRAGVWTPWTSPGSTPAPDAFLKVKMHQNSVFDRGSGSAPDPEA